MIEIGDKFVIRGDGHSWALESRYNGTEKATGKVKHKWRTTYHGSLRAVCNKIVTLGSVEDVKSLEDILTRMDEMKENLFQQISGSLPESYKELEHSLGVDK